MLNLKETINLKGFEITEKVYESRTILVLRGQRLEDGRTVIIKTHSTDYPTDKDTQKILKEYEILSQVNDAEFIIKAYDIVEADNRVALILEDINGVSLRDYLQNRKLELKEFLNLARQMARMLEELHSNNIIHKDINPNNIILNAEAGRYKIIDFDISSRLSIEKVEVESPNVRLGTLPYISPEQTGRMNRSIDYRTDFYSLGVTFYEMITGQLPFNSKDPMAMVHCHIAKQPAPPTEVESDIPAPVGQIILKMLAKTAEDRYQSAYGLRADLETALTNFENTGTVPAFRVGGKDVSERFKIPQKLYGRQKEIQSLLNAFERITQASSEFVLASGYSGIGKSALIHEIHRPIVSERGYFISGKFDQLRRDVPYASLIQAFQELIRQLLTESEEQIALWKANLLKALGPNGQIIIDVIPEVELIIGPQPPVTELGAQEAENRFNIVFQNFVGVFTQKEHPLVLFLDDLQWADAASLKMIQLLLIDHEINYLLLVGAYRDNEVDEAHPFMLMLAEVEKAQVKVNDIKLKPLNAENINQLIADTLHKDIHECRDLADIIYRKTNGNPFFVNEFLKTLYSKKLLYFDFKEGNWQWNADIISSSLEVTDNVVELMTSKIKELAPKAQHIIKLASCLGSTFKLEALALIAQKSPEETEKDLWETLNEDLIYKYGESYKFIHDRIRQAAYTLIEEDEKQRIHLEYGRQMLSTATDKEIEEHLFDLINHLNIGRKLVTQRAEKDTLIQYNLKAGQKAKASTAYEPAYNFLTIGTEFIDKNTWDKHYNMALRTFTELVEVSYLSARFDEMQRNASIVENNAKDLLDKLRVFEIKIAAYLAQNKMLEGVNNMREALKLVGVKLPQKPGKLNVLAAIIKTKLLMRGKKIDDLKSLNRMEDPYKQAAMRIIASGSSAAYYAMPSIFPLLIIKMVELSIKYGNYRLSSPGYCTYGLIIIRGLGDINNGYQWGKFSLDLQGIVEGGPQHKAQLNAVYNAFIQHQKEHLKNTLPGFLSGYQSGIENGQVEFACACVLMYDLYALLLGKELGGLNKEMRKYTEVTRKFNQERHFRNNEMRRQVVLNLLGEVEDLTVLTGEAANEEEWARQYEEANDSTGQCMMYIFKMMLCYLFNDVEGVLVNEAKAQKHLDGIAGLYLQSSYYLFSSLALLQDAANNPDKLSKHLSKVKANQKKVAKMMKFAPMNHAQKYWLVEAERARIEGNDQAAMKYYDDAIKHAKENEFVNDEALANELAAKFYLARNMNKFASLYFIDATYANQKWGAKAKVEQLRADYGDYIGNVQEAAQSHYTTSTREIYTTLITGGTETSSLDINTVIKSSQALSGEIILSQLLEKLMNIALENAGAQRGYLILKRDADLYIEAEADLNEDRIIVQQGVKVSNSVRDKLPISLINYVSRTNESQVLQDAANQGNYTKDFYIQQNTPKSIICTPVIRQGKNVGVLYLENNLTTYAFTKERIEVLNLLSSQAAISLENAMLYESLEEKVRERTAKLRDAADEIEKKSQSITDSINYAKRIQDAMLPQVTDMATNMPNSFVLFKPRDIVSGDFFFVGKQNNKTIVAAVDCTGHGVPGAFMSITGNSLLQQIVYERKVTEPDIILKELHKGIRTSLKQEETENRDGMDMALVVIDHEAKTLEFAGAKNPFIFIKDDKLELIKGSKMPIGGMQREAERVFEKHVIPIDAPLTCYVFSDGYQDQFGGPQGRKFMVRHFRSLLHEIHAQPMDQQQDRLEKTINDWMGKSHKQLDDILVIGFKVQP